DRMGLAAGPAVQMRLRPLGHGGSVGLRPAGGLGCGEDGRGWHPTSVGGHSGASRWCVAGCRRVAPARWGGHNRLMHEGTRPPLRTLLIDNHDSFTLNLFHLLARVNGREPLLTPNDWDGWDPQVLETVDSVVLSPGPGTPLRPEDVGICAEAVAAARVPVLGICLGHQLIAHLHGAHVGRAPEPRHGRVSAIEHDGTGLFAGIPDPFSTVRYHSLAATEVVEPLRITARSEDGVVQGIEHSTVP